MTYECQACNQVFGAEGHICKIKDHEIAKIVNDLRDVAVEFHATQQLRERIAQVIVPALKGKI